ncbi:unnamed protein product [Lampetra planeri]
MCDPGEAIEAEAPTRNPTLASPVGAIRAHKSALIEWLSAEPLLLLESLLASEHITLGVYEAASGKSSLRECVNYLLEHFIGGGEDECRVLLADLENVKQHYCSDFRDCTKAETGGNDDGDDGEDDGDEYDDGDDGEEDDDDDGDDGDDDGDNDGEDDDGDDYDDGDDGEDEDDDGDNYGADDDISG